MKYCAELFRRTRNYIAVFFLLLTVSVTFTALHSDRAMADQTEPGAADGTESVLEVETEITAAETEIAAAIETELTAETGTAPASAGRLEITASVTGTNAAMLNDILADSRITVRTAEKDGAFLLNLDTILSGEDILRVLLEVTQEKLAFSVPDIYQTRYEYALADLLETLQSAAQSAAEAQPGAAPLSASAIPGDAVEEIAAEAVSVLAPYGEYLMNTISESMREEPGPFTLPHLGITADGTILSWEPDAAELAGILENLADQIEKDEAAAEFAEHLADSASDPAGIGALITQASASSGEEVDLQEIKTSIEEGYRSLPSILREGAASLTEDGMGDTYFRLNEYTAASELCGFSFQAGTAEEMMVYTGFESDPEHPGRSWCLFFETPDQDFSFSYNRTDTGDGLEKTILTAKAFRFPIFTLTFTSDPSGENAGFPIRDAVLDILGVNLSITFSKEGTADDENAILLSLRGIGLPDDGLGLTGVDIRAVTGTTDGADMEAPFGPVSDISAYSPDQLGELFGSIGESIASRAEEIFISAQ